MHGLQPHQAGSQLGCGQRWRQLQAGAWAGLSQAASWRYRTSQPWLGRASHPSRRQSLEQGLVTEEDIDTAVHRLLLAR